VTQRRGPPPPPIKRVAHGPIPIVPWSSAPPPAPPRTFETEPPEPVPPSAPTLPRHEPIDPRAFADEARDDARRAVEAREEARGFAQQVLEEALAPLHFRVHELERRIDMLESAAKAAAARPVPAPVPTQPFEAAPSAPRMYADMRASPGPMPAAMPAQVRAPAPQSGPFYAAPMELGAPAPPAPMAPMAPQYPVVPAPPAMPKFDGYDIDVPFDGRRRKRNVILMFAALFVVAVGGLLASMVASYMR
jgi:hypothetical protein